MSPDTLITTTAVATVTAPLWKQALAAMLGFLGIPDDTAYALLNAGVPGVLGIVSLLVFVKFVIPAARDWWKRSIDMSTAIRESSDAMVTAVKTLDHKMDSMVSELYYTGKKIDILTEAKAGEITQSQALRLFATWQEKQHDRALCFYTDGVKKIKQELAIAETEEARDAEWDSFATVMSTEANRMAMAHTDFLADFTLKGRPLTDFWGKALENGEFEDSVSFWRHHFVALHTVAKNNYDRISSFSEFSIKHAQDRIVSTLMSAFKRWMEDPNRTFSSTKESYNFHELSFKLGQIELITDDDQEAMRRRYREVQQKRKK